MTSKSLLALAFAATALNASGSALAETYQWKDSSGQTVISDTPPPATVKSRRSIGGNQPSVVSEKSARPNSLVPMICSSCLTLWLTALGVTHNSSAAWVTERRRASASKVNRHWMGGMREATDMVDQLGAALKICLAR